jgi:hypothetical protein
MIRYMTISKFAAETGYTEDAIRTKIRDGVWPKDQVWVKAPDGRVLIDAQGYEKWVETGGELKLGRKAVLTSPSCIKAFDAGKGSRSSPPPLT